MTRRRAEWKIIKNLIYYVKCGGLALWEAKTISRVAPGISNWIMTHEKSLFTTKHKNDCLHSS